MWTGYDRPFGQCVPNVRVIARACIQETALDHRLVSDVPGKRLHVSVPISEMDDCGLCRNDSGGNSEWFTSEAADRNFPAHPTTCSFPANTVPRRGHWDRLVLFGLRLFPAVRLCDLHEFLERLASI